MTLPTILIDSREKYPWKFTGYRSKTTSLAKYGSDYSLHGYSSLIGIERKSLWDFVNSNDPRNRKRFHASLNKLRKRKKFVILVEGDPSQYHYISEKKGQKWKGEWIASNAVFLTTMGVPVVFCSTRQIAEETAINFFYYSKEQLDKHGLADDEIVVPDGEVKVIKPHPDITEIN